METQINKPMSILESIRNPRRPMVLKAACIALAVVTTYSSGATGFNAAALFASEQLQRQARKYPGHFTDRPTKVYLGENPGRDPVGRGGMWTPQLLKDLRGVRAKQALRAPKSEFELWASTNPDIRALVAQTNPGGGGGDPGGGAGEPGEGGGPGGGPGGNPGGTGGSGDLNTNTGNRLVDYEIVGWDAFGDQSIDFRLFHNSKGEYSFDLGKGWSHSYDMQIDHTVGSSAIVRYGSGREVPYTETSGIFDAPAGVHDELVHNVNGTWTLTSHGQWEYLFDADGYLVNITDRDGNMVVIQRNGSHKPISVTDPTNRSIYFTYNASGLIETVEDPLGREWEFTYNGSNQMTAISYPELDTVTYQRTFTYNSLSDILTETDRRGKTWTYTYDSGENLLTFTNPLSKTWTYTYGTSAVTLTQPDSTTIVHNYSSGLIASEVDEASYSTAYVYDSDKNVTQVTDKRGKVWAYTYDSNGNRLTATNPLSQTTTYTFNSTNDVVTVTDGNSNTTSYTYDSNGNLLEVEDALSRTVVTNTFASGGLLDESEDAMGRVTEYSYDSDGNLISEEAPSGVTVSATYNAIGWVATSTAANGGVTTPTYDEWGRVVEVDQPGSVTVEVEYDAEGNITSATDGLSRTGTVTYDDLGRPTSSTNAKSETTTQAYNDLGDLVSITNARGKTRSYTYTARGEVATLTMPDSTHEFWSYDGQGNVTSYTNGVGQVINHIFDDAGQQTKIDYPTGTDTTFSYDSGGRQAAMSDQTGTASWTYNSADEVTQLVTPQGTLQYTYNLDGQQATMVEPGIGTTIYGYDSHGRLTSVTDPYSDVTSYVYNGINGLLFKKTLGNGTYETYSFDTRMRMTRNQVKNSSDSTIWDYQYVYDDADQVTQYSVGGVVTSYGYDAIGQLTSETKSGGTTYSGSYTYDANGNRLTRTVNGITETYTYDDGDKLTAITGGTDPRTYTYDGAGRTTGIVRSGGTTGFTYDYESRIISITKPGMTTNSFTYNGLDTRVGMTDSTGTKTFKRIGVSVTSAVISDGTAYYNGNAEHRSGTSTWFHSGLKNIEYQTKSTNVTQGRREYDAFGNIVSSGGTFQSQFGYGGAYGYQEDVDLGLKLLGHRYVDTSTGRFLTRDPVHEGRNWYAYSWSDPVNYADPTGLVKDPNKTAWNYRLLYTSDNSLAKHGVTTQDPPIKRYSGPYYEKNKVYMVVDAEGPKHEVYARERSHVRTNPGPMNREHWAGIDDPTNPNYRGKGGGSSGSTGRGAGPGRRGGGGGGRSSGGALGVFATIALGMDALAKGLPLFIGSRLRYEAHLRAIDDPNETETAMWEGVDPV